MYSSRLLFRINSHSSSTFANARKLGGFRMTSTLVGASGRVYVRDKLLRTHPRNSQLNIYLANCEGQSFVLKPVSKSIFEHSVTIKRHFPDASQLRTHVDVNEDDQILIYEYFACDLLRLMQKNLNLSLKAKKSILREVGQALEKLHSKQWIHLDIKPDNIMVDYNENNQGRIEIERVVLSDLDCSLQLEGDRLLNARIGNVMWRSPEAQVGKGIGKPSDVFSYGLLCLYVITGIETLHPDFEELKEAGIEPELEIMSRLITFFGPVPSGLKAYLNDERWGGILTELSETTAEDPSMRFNQWTEETFPNLNAETKRVITMMTKLDPLERATMSEVLKDPWWGNDEVRGVSRE